MGRRITKLNTRQTLQDKPTRRKVLSAGDPTDTSFEAILEGLKQSVARTLNTLNRQYHQLDIGDITTYNERTARTLKIALEADAKIRNGEELNEEELLEMSDDALHNLLLDFVEEHAEEE